MKTITTQISESIRERRESKGISQEQLAHLAEVSRNYISEIERGKRNVTIESLQRITTALDCTLSDFFLKIEHSDAPVISKTLQRIKEAEQDDQNFIIMQVEQLLDWKNEK